MIQVVPRNPLRFLLPTDNLRFESAESPTVVRVKLQAVISEKPPFNPIRDLKLTFTFPKPALPTPFFGTFTPDGINFAMHPALHHRNAWRPQITGEIQPHGTGSEVSVKMRVQPFALIFTFGYSLLLVSIMLFLYFNGAVFDASTLIVMGVMPVILYIGMLISFWMEANLAKSVIEKTLR